MCVLYSASMTGAKLLANLDESHFGKLKECGGKITLHLAFSTPGKGLPVTFFVSSRVVGFRPYQTKNPNTNLVSIEYGQKPPDQLIEILGRLLETTQNASRRKEVRIPLDEAAVRNLELQTKSASLRLAGGAFKALLLDLSFSGSKVLLPASCGAGPRQKAALGLLFADADDPIEVPSTVLRVEPLPSRAELITAALLFEEEHAPLAYTTRINEYFSKKNGQRA